MEETDIRDKILKGSEELFMRYGVRSISMDDIARHLGVSKKTLYQHFADKDELVLTVSHCYLQRYITQFDSVRNEAKNPVEELAKISVCMKQNLEAMNPALLYDLQKFHPKAWSEWIAFKGKYLRDSIVRNLNQGIAEGYIRADINPEIMAAMRIELVQLAFNPDIFPSNRFQLTQVQEQIFDHFVFGLVTDKGKKLYQKLKKINLQPAAT